MIKLNEYQTTKDGKYVIPVAVMGDTVQCYDINGESIYKKISSFDERNLPNIQNTEKEVVEVSPVESKNTDQLHNEDEDQPDDGLREDDSTDDSSSSDDGYADDDSYI